MSGLINFEWENRVKTTLRGLKIGDIFCFELNGNGYGVGRIMTRNSLGHVAEIFDEVLQAPIVKEVPLKRVGHPIILDSYSLFDRKTEGDWRVVAHDPDYKPSAAESVRFVYGVADNTREVDIFDNEAPLADKNKRLPSYSPMGDEDVKEYINLY